MKISQLKKIVKEAVKEAIQEEMKDILLEAVRVPKTIVETKKSTTPQFEQQNPLPDGKKKELRENMMNVLNGMMPGANRTINATTADVPLQVGSGDTTSPNGRLPEGSVSIDQIMGLMNSKG